jgi:predicted AAA+ superfamily ATPase
MADARLSPHNLQWQGVQLFLQQDPVLRRLRDNPLVSEPDLLERLPLEIPGIYTLVGGRQVGKSTLLKQVMQRLLQRERVAPERLAYVTCEPFVDAEELRVVLTDLLAAMPGGERSWLLIDEVTYVAGWDRTVKFLADAGTLERCFVLLTGSDHVLIQDSLKRLPGRRGRADAVDFHLRPLSFLQFCRLRGRMSEAVLEELSAGDVEADLPRGTPASLSELEGELRSYHVSGGFLTATNDVARDGVVAAATLRIYADWIRGDLLRLNRNERYLREVLAAISERYGSQLTWNALAQELSIDHPKTIADYLGILERLDAVLVVPALAEHERGPAPKKGRKVFFADPFIHRAAQAFVARAEPEPGSDAHLQRDLEATMAGHVARFAEALYVKGKGEIDVAWYAGRKLRLLEVKWSQQLRPEELKEIRRRGRGLIASRARQAGKLDGLKVLPAAVVLLRLAALA